MKFSAVNLLAFSFSLASSQMWGGPGGDGWGFAPACAQGCLSSFYPTSTSAWASHCATPTPSSLSSCISSSCSDTHSTYSTILSIKSSLCSAYSSCSSNSQSCSSWPFFGGQFDGPDIAIEGWGGETGANGCFTVTGTNGHTSGYSTRTVVVTTTVMTGGSTVVGLLTETQTATLVAAAVATRSNSAAAVPTSKSDAMRRGNGMSGTGWLVTLALGVGIAF